MVGRRRVLYGSPTTSSCRRKACKAGTNEQTRVAAPIKSTGVSTSTRAESSSSSKPRPTNRPKFLVSHSVNHTFHPNPSPNHLCTVCGRAQEMLSVVASQKIALSSLPPSRRSVETSREGTHRLQRSE